MTGMDAIFPKTAIYEEFPDIPVRCRKGGWHALGESNPSFQVENLAS